MNNTTMDNTTMDTIHINAHINIDSINCKTDSMPELKVATSELRNVDTVNNERTDIKSVVPQSIYRFKLSDDVSYQLKYFAQIHKYDDRKTFKDAWNEWSKDNTQLLMDEKTRLNLLGYKGDVLKKMYVSVRYYYKNKSNKPPETEHKQVKRRQYIKLDKSILQLMDRHIQEYVQTPNYKPAMGFKTFVEENYYTIDNEITRLIANSTLNKDAVNLKLKKTYKNRYYIFTTK